MANITEEHLHHMARRHHATMQKLDGIRERITGITSRALGTIEIGAGAWIGGVVEGRSGGYSVLNLPVNLLAGGILLAVGYSGFTGQYSEHVSNLGNGVLGSYLAATGYAFGKRWKETKRMFGGGGHPWMDPYGTHETAPGAQASGDLSEAQMAAIVQRMQAAAGAPAHP